MNDNQVQNNASPVCFNEVLKSSPTNQNLENAVKLAFLILNT